MFVSEKLQFSEVLSPQLCLLLAKLGMCCLNFTGILSVQLLLLMRYSIQFLPMTLQEEAAQWNIIIMGAANRQLWDQENGGQVIATTTYSLGEQTTQIVQHHEVQCLA